MQVLEQRCPVPIRYVAFAFIGVFGTVAVALLAVTATATDDADVPPLLFAVFFALVWLWNVYWWAWVSPYRVEVGDDRCFEFVSVLGRRTTVPGATIRSLEMSWMMVPVLRHDGGRVLLLPLAPTARLVQLLRAEYPAVEIKLPSWVKLP